MASGLHQVLPCTRTLPHDCTATIGGSGASAPPPPRLWAERQTVQGHRQERRKGVKVTKDGGPWTLIPPRLFSSLWPADETTTTRSQCTLHGRRSKRVPVVTPTPPTRQLPPCEILDSQPRPRVISTSPSPVLISLCPSSSHQSTISTLQHQAFQALSQLDSIHSHSSILSSSTNITSTHPNPHSHPHPHTHPHPPQPPSCLPALPTPPL